MTAKTRNSAMVFILIVLLWVSVRTAQAGQESGSFPTGKMMRIVVGYGPGGGFDTFSRLLARHMGRYLPGEPRIIVQNMPGAGSLVAANRIYADQPGDGLTIVSFHYSMVTQAIVGDPAVKFDPLKYIWLGDPAIGGLPRVLFIHSDLPIRTLADLMKRKEPLALGVSGVAEGAAIAGKFLRDIGVPVKNVVGYRGSASVFAAVERKEVDGRFTSQASVLTIHRRYLDEGILRPILIIGIDPRVKPLPGLATLDDIKMDPEQRQMADFLIRTWKYLRLYALPPGTPPDTVQLLREAFHKALKSPKLASDAERQGVIVPPATWEDIEQAVNGLRKAPPEIVEKYRKLIGFKK